MASNSDLRPYTTRLQKGGALLDVMRQLTLHWGEVQEGAGPATAGLPSRRRANDVIKRAFIPRWVDSKPPKLWKVAAAVERTSADRATIATLHYYATACSEPLLWDFVVQNLSTHAGSGAIVTTADVLRFLSLQDDVRFPRGRWTDTVATKVARGVLAALRDYGVLAGESIKKLAALYLPVRAFALIARLRYEVGHRGADAVSDDAWRLFFLSDTDVRRLFVEAHSEHLLTFESAGPVTRLEFPKTSVEDYAKLIARQSPAAARI